MRPAFITRKFPSQYQQKLKLDPSSRPVGLEREIKLSRQASDTFDAAMLNHLLQINWDNSARDCIARQCQALEQNSAKTDPSSRMNTE